LIRAGCGLSERDDATEAVLRATDDAMTEGALTEPRAAFVFATHPHAERLGELAQSITELCGAEAVAGASGTGVLTSAGEIEGRPGVAVLLVQAEEISFTTFGVESLRGRDDEVAGEIALALRSSVRRGADKHAMLALFPDPLALDPLRFFPALERAFGPVPAIGGGATSHSGQAAAVYGHHQVSHGLAGMLIDGRFSAQVTRFASARLISRTMKITRCHANLVFELDGLPALVVFQNLAARVLGLDPVRAAQTAFVALPTGSPETGPGEFLVRSVVGLDPARQVIALSQPVESGGEMAFCLLEPAEARRRLADGLQALRDAAPSFGLYFNCAGRGQRFYGEEGVDTRALREVLGPVPIAGFFSGAEIAPVGGRNMLHFYTSILALFGPD
jgi:small ligand-binding sensory domain FIST